MFTLKYGSVVAAHYVSKFMEQALPYLGIEPIYSENDKENEQIIVPDVTSMSVDKAIKLLNSQKINYEIVGNGEIVQGQMPQKNSKINKKDGKVIIYAEKNVETSVQVPNVIGLSAEKANLVLTNCGLNIKFDGALNFKYGESARVFSQSIPQGTWVEKGTIITINILFTDDEE